MLRHATNAALAAALRWFKEKPLPDSSGRVGRTLRTAWLFLRRVAVPTTYAASGSTLRHADICEQLAGEA
jgi:hypothetical protein